MESSEYKSKNKETYQYNQLLQLAVSGTISAKSLKYYYKWNLVDLFKMTCELAVYVSDSPAKMPMKIEIYEHS